MQPNDQQGYYRPEGQPVQPQAPPEPPTAQPQAAPAPTPDQSQASAPVAQPVQPAQAPAPVSAEPLDLNDEYEQDEFDDDQSLDQPVTWVAHEYIHQEKGALWFTVFAVVVIALLAISILLMQSWSFAVLLAVIAVVVIVYSRRPPRELTYTLTDDGLTIDQTLHKFSTFKSFGIIRDGEEFSVMLIPTRRFQPGITIYFPEEAGEDIVDMLGSRLPMRDLHLDVVDRVVRLLRL